MKGRKKRNQLRNERGAPGLLPAIVAVGGACGLASAPVSALELGQIQMESTLGQPLRASIAYALGPNEQLFDFCVSLRPNMADTAIPGVSRARISIRDGAIILTGNTAVKDPLLNVRLAVDCPYTPHLIREYTVIVDPVLPDRTAPMVAQNQAASPAAEPTYTATATPTARASAQVLSEGASFTPDELPIQADSEYRVQTGDTASTIVTRVEGRTIGLWPGVDALVRANPQAFADGDADRIMAGSVLYIPDMSAMPDRTADTPGSAPVGEPVDIVEIPEPALAMGSAEATATAPVELPPVESIADTPAGTDAFVDVPADDPAVEIPSADAPAAVGDIPADEIAELAEPAADEQLRPGDIVMTPPVVETAENTAPVVQSADGTAATSGAWGWLAWLAGAGLALFLGLLFFGRTIKARFGSVAVGAPEPDRGIEDDEPRQTNRVLDDVDFQFGETMAEDPISLDADLDAGTGLQEGTEMDVAQDFGFTTDGQAESEVDMEITEEAARETEDKSTDIIPPTHRVEESSILQSEIPPEMADDDYDMSMIVDATKQTIDEYDATAKDLHAIQVGQEDEYSISDDTLATEADLAALEQDYEEEFTATQALNQEIEKAAAELAKRMEEEDPGAAAEQALEPTAEMPAQTRDPEITAELTANLPTDVEAENDDVADSDVTSKMAAAGSDVTVEMQVESGKVDTKKKPKAEA